MMEYFPLGITQYWLGGIFVGLGIVLLFFLKGSPVGASTAFAAVISYFSKLPFFRDKRLLAMRDSRLLFSLGFILGGFIYAAATSNWFQTSLHPMRLILGGVLIGFGTRMGRGCTAGHGLCGIGFRSWQSVVAVAIFLTTAIITANLIGGFP